jgi:chorismate mutase
MSAIPSAATTLEPASAGDPEALPDRWRADPGRNDLAALRAELDRLDDALHDLLMRRAAVVAQVAATKPPGTSGLRPGREAAILRRLLARHGGPLPARGVVRIWRELLAATTAMQGPFVIAVSDPGPGGAITAAAREQFGALTPLRAHGSPAGAIAEVAEGRAALAVLPMPRDDEPTAWWTGLVHRDAPRLHVVARLPFWTRRPEGAPDIACLVLAALPPDPSGADTTLIGCELDPAFSRGRLHAAVTAAGFVPLADGALPGGLILRRLPREAETMALIELPGFVTADDPRLARLAAGLRAVTVLGACAIPPEDPAP